MKKLLISVKYEKKLINKFHDNFKLVWKGCKRIGVSYKEKDHHLVVYVIFDEGECFIIFTL